jgi:SRSO17 transposase
MNRRELTRLDGELTEYLDTMLDGMGRVERVAAMRSYVTGLLLDGERKSIEPMAARLVDRESEIQAMRQRLQQAVTIANWGDEELLGRLAGKIEAELPGIEALVIDDTGFAKKGQHSVGVARQYSGTLGRIDNCQVATSLHLAGENASACIAFDLYLPEEWARDGARRTKAGVPDDIEFRTKHQIALDQLDRALADGVRQHVVLTDAGYGESTEFRRELTARGLHYVVAVNGEPVVWPPESRPQIEARPPGSPGRPRTRYRDEAHPPERIAALAARLKYRRVTWREGSRGWQASRFAAARIRTAHRHDSGTPPGDEQWLLCEWPVGDEAPSRFWLATLPADTSVRKLVRLAKLRWRVERDYQEMKQEIGLDHYEGRTWRGFHHHATLCAVAHGFLALRRALFPPEQDEVDDLAGQAGPSTGASSPNRTMPALSSRGRQTHVTDGSLADVIESY